MTPLETVYDYVEGVLAGRILACKYIHWACLRFLKDVVDTRWVFDEEELNRTIAFCRLCKHWKGKNAGQFFEPEPWQVFIIANVFCFKEPDTGLRRFRDIYVEIPRKNGKSFLCAVIALRVMLLDNDSGMEVYIGATKQQQAKIVWTNAKMMVKRSPLMSKQIRARYDRLERVEDGTICVPLGRDSETLDGLNPSLGIIDEYHAHKNSLLYDVLASGQASRSEPLMWIITTAGFILTGPCMKKHNVAVEVLNPESSVNDDSMFAIIYTIDEGDDWKDPKTWEKANPNYRVSVYERVMAADAHAVEVDIGKLPEFLTKHLDVWFGSQSVWIKLAKWDALVGDMPDFERFRGMLCYGGIDIASSNDLCSFSVVWMDEDAEPREDGKEEWFLYSMSWCPRENAETRAKEHRVPYLEWEQEGWLKLTPGDVVDQRQIRRDIVDFFEKTGLVPKGVGIDPWAVQQFNTEMMEDEGVPMIEHRQGYASMSPSMKAAERLIYGKELTVCGHNPTLRWAISNVFVQRDAAGNIKPNKDKSGDKIDPAVSMIIAIGVKEKLYEGPSEVSLTILS